MQRLENLIKDSGGAVTDLRNNSIDREWVDVISRLDTLVTAINWHDLDERDDIVYGNPPLSEAQARTIIDTVERGKAVNVTHILMRRGSGFQLKFDNLEHEWGILKYTQALDECKLIIGERTGVTWDAAFLQVGIPVSHSHPYFEAGKVRNRLMDVSTATKEIADHPGFNVAGIIKWSDLDQRTTADAGREVSKIFPSASDIAFCGKHHIANHHVYTTYAVLEHNVYGKCIANPNISMRGIQEQPRLVFIITGARPAGDGENYTCTMSALSGTQQFWTKTVTTNGTGQFGLLTW